MSFSLKQKNTITVRKKGEGYAIHIFNFIVEQTGQLALDEEECQIDI
jgi:hypothetical protein